MPICKKKDKDTCLDQVKLSWLENLNEYIILSVIADINRILEKGRY